MNKAITDGAQLMPPDFAQAPGAFSSGDGTSGSQSYAGRAAIISADVDFGSCLEIIKTEATQTLRYMGETPLLPGCYLRISARVKAISGALPTVRIAGFAGGSRGEPVAGVQTTGPVTPLHRHDQVVEVAAIVGPGARNGVDMIWGAQALYGHFGLDLTGPTGGVVRVESIIVEDITSVFLRDMMGVVDVRDFGALGDGETDDSLAFEATDAAARGRSVLVPPGRYVLKRDVMMNAPVQFEGHVIMPDDATLLLRRNFDLPGYTDAFGTAELGLRKGIEALMCPEAPDVFDLKGGEVVLSAPLQILQSNRHGAGRSRKTITNGKITAQASPDWTVSKAKAQLQWSATAPSVLQGDVDQIPLGARVHGLGVQAETYVCATDLARRSIALNRPLDEGGNTRALSFERFKYLIDFSGLDDFTDVDFSRVTLSCDGSASGVMLATKGKGVRFVDCTIQDARDRALTSCGTGCEGLMLDGCDISGSSGLGINAISDNLRIVNTRAAGAHLFAHVTGRHALVTGCHVTQTGDGLTAQPGIILTQGENGLVSGCHFENCTVVFGTTRRPMHPVGNIFSGDLRAGGVD